MIRYKTVQQYYANIFRVFFSGCSSAGNKTAKITAFSAIRDDQAMTFFFHKSFVKWVARSESILFWQVKGVWAVKTLLYFFKWFNLLVRSLTAVWNLVDVKKHNCWIRFQKLRFKELDLKVWDFFIWRVQNALDIFW